MSPLGVVVALPPTIKDLVSERAVVEAPPFNEERPVTVKAPVEVSEAAEIEPVVVKVLAVKELETMRLEVLAVPDTWRLVVVAPVKTAEVAKRLVEVASVVVDFSPVKFWRVVEPTTKRSPVELMVVVAVPPKYAVSKTEKRVDEAWMNEARPV